MRLRKLVLAVVPFVLFAAAQQAAAATSLGDVGLIADLVVAEHSCEMADDAVEGALVCPAHIRALLMDQAEGECASYGGRVGYFNIVTCFHLGGGWYRVRYTYGCVY